MRIISIVLTFILSTQLVFASATVCDHYGKCGTQQVESQMNDMADCPHHKKTEPKEEKNESQPECKCCVVVTYENHLSAKPTLESLISFIQFTDEVQQVNNHSSIAFRPPIS